MSADLIFSVEHLRQIKTLAELDNEDLDPRLKWDQHKISQNDEIIDICTEALDD